MTAIKSAVALGAEGLWSFPCGENKQPACPHGFKDAAVNEMALRELWQRHPGSHVGVATGEVSGFDVLDIDRKHNEAVDWLLDNRHRIPNTRVHRTRSGGLHYHFRHQPGLRCWTARPVIGVDGRSGGGYVIWWPAAGLPVLSDAPLADWPGWLLTELAPAPGPPSVSPVPSGSEVSDRYAAAALDNAVQRISQAGEGVRNSTLNAEAFSLGRFVEVGVLGGQVVADALAFAAISAGLRPREVEATLKSAFRARGLA
jgi:hypothetical protein